MKKRTIFIAFVWVFSLMIPFADIADWVPKAAESTFVEPFFGSKSMHDFDLLRVRWAQKFDLFGIYKYVSEYDQRERQARDDRWVQEWRGEKVYENVVEKYIYKVVPGERFPKLLYGFLCFVGFVVAAVAMCICMIGFFCYASYCRELADLLLRGNDSFQQKPTLLVRLYALIILLVTCILVATLAAPFIVAYVVPFGLGVISFAVWCVGLILFWVFSFFGMMFQLLVVPALLTLWYFCSLARWYDQKFFPSKGLRVGVGISIPVMYRRRSR